MPIEAPASMVEERAQFSHLEAVGRLICGLAPLLELESATVLDSSLVNNFHQLLDSISTPSSRDFLNFTDGKQPLVDASFLALGLLRAPTALWMGLNKETQTNLVALLQGTREICPSFSNWLLFSAVIEAFFYKAGLPWDRMRIDYALRQHEQWYLGDGHYADGPEFNFDYYNSFVIHPLLLEITLAVKGESADWNRIHSRVLLRAQRYAVQLERLIGPDGTYPPIGRSLAYRCGAFHLLAQLAWRGLLPSELSAAQVRCALFAVVEKTLSRAENFDAQGWLRVGINGAQPGIAENYISTGSLYLCSTAFLPLGLPEADPFWAEPDAPWTQRRLWWLCDEIPIDKALKL